MAEPLIDPNEAFAGNSAINADIHQLLAEFPEPSRSRMLRQIRRDRDVLMERGTEQADQQARHTFREFLCARRLNQNGFHLEYSRKFGEQTPDWFDPDRRLVLEVFTCERGGKSDPVTRVADRIAEKVAVYRQLVEDQQLFFVVAVYGDFLCGFGEYDCEQAISDGDLFGRYRELSGVLFFSETTVVRRQQQYGFTYFPNAKASRRIDLRESLTGGQP